ncbi:MAG: TlpA family protein disulfide reductase [Phycisphaerales bacterium]
MPRFGRLLWITLAILALVPGALAQPPTPHPALDAYRAWLAADEAKHLSAVVIRGTDAAEADRIAALLAANGFTARVIERTQLPGADLAKTDLLVITRDTHTANWSKPWGSDEEAAALKAANKPMICIGEGGVVCFGRTELPVRGGRTMRSSSDSTVKSNPQHALFAAPHTIPADEAGQIKIFMKRVTTQPAHRSAFTQAVIPLCADSTAGRDYALLLYQSPGAAYWGAEGSFAELTNAGKDLFDNLAHWTIWASRQRDSALLREGIVSRPDPLRRGDRSVELTLTRSDGSPAINTAFTVEINDSTKGKGWTPFSTGRTDASARADIESLTGGPDAEHYRVMVSSAAVPAVSIYLAEGPQKRAMSGRIPPLVGDAAPDLQFIDIATNKPVRLSDYRGRVVYIDFWATWCVPCQEPMRHNNEIARKNADPWKGRAVILGISTDTDATKVRKHVADRGWADMPQLWVPGPEGKPGTGAGEAFGFVGIPSGFLLDRRGIIRWRGHPAGIDAAVEIEKLLNEPAPAPAK